MPTRGRGRENVFMRFLRDDSGTATVEFVLWLPILLLIIAISSDAALIFGTKAQILRIIQDANRGASIGRLRTEDETEAFVRTAMGSYATRATIVTTFNAGVVSTTVTLPTSDLTATGILGRLSNLTLTVNAQHLLEA